MPNTKPVSRTEDLVVQEANNEVLIYDLRSNKAFCLNETSSLVWKACDGTRDISQLRTSVGEALGSTVSDEFIWLALDQLQKNTLIDSLPETNEVFTGMSRREVIRKIGVGSMVALPVVASLVAPTAIQAQTCLANGTPTGNATLSTNCGTSTPASQNAACDAQQGATCCSTNAISNGSCSGNPGVVGCVCAP